MSSIRFLKWRQEEKYSTEAGELQEGVPEGLGNNSLIRGKEMFRHRVLEYWCVAGGG